MKITIVTSLFAEGYVNVDSAHIFADCSINNKQLAVNNEKNIEIKLIQILIIAF